MLVRRAAVGVVVIVLGIIAVRHWQESPPTAVVPPPAPSPMRGAWVPAEGLEVGGGGDYLFGLALGPGGRQLVYPATKAGLVQLWHEDLSSGERRPLDGTTGAVAPFWHPDGTRVGFFADGVLRVVDVQSGSVSDLLAMPEFRGAAWNASGDIVFAAASTGPLMRRAVDGTVSALTTIDKTAGEVGHAWPAFLDEGRHVAFLVTASNAARGGIWLASLHEASSRRRIAASDAQPIVAGDRLLFISNTTLMSQPVPAAPDAAPRPEAVALGVGRGPLAQAFVTAAADALIYGAPGSPRRNLQWFARDGTPLDSAGEPLDAWDLRIAPDGRRVAVTELDPQLRTLDVVVRDRGQPAPRRISLSTDLDESAVWSPDAARIAWAGGRRTVMIRGAGGLLPEQTLATMAPPVQVWDWSGDGKTLLVGRSDASTAADLWALNSSGSGEPWIVTQAGFNQVYGALSAEGRWIAYASDESGQYDVYVDTFPKPGKRVRVTTAGGTEPRWRADGRELYFRRGREIFAVTITNTAGAREIGAEVRLFDAGASIRAFDATADGKRFLVNIPGTGSQSRIATLVMHWRQEH